MKKSKPKIYTGRYGFGKYVMQRPVSSDLNEVLTDDIKLVNKLDKNTLSAIVDFLSRIANTRLTKLEKANMTYAPAYKSVMDNQGRFNYRDKNLNQLRSEYVRLYNFMTSETGSVQKMKRVHSKMEQRLGVSSFSQKQTDLLWSAYNKIKELKQFYDSGQVQSDIAQMIEQDNTLTADDIIAKVNEKITEDYERNEETYNEIIKNLSPMF